MESTENNSKFNLNCRASFNGKLEDELEYQNKTFEKGPFLFLMTRVEHEYNRKPTIKRRQLLEEQSGLNFPLLTDEIIESLYWHTVENYKDFCRDNYEHSGFPIIASERDFIRTFNQIKESLPILKGVELLPTINSTRMAIGPYVPDFLAFGLSKGGKHLVSIEIDGSIHDDPKKAAKDKAKAKNLFDMGIATIPVPNNFVNNPTSVKAIFTTASDLSNISRRKDQLGLINRKIWIKTIANHNSLQDIENYIFNNFQTEPNLIKEFHLLAQLKSCPRDIKKEYKKYKTEKWK